MPLPPPFLPFLPYLPSSAPTSMGCALALTICCALRTLISSLRKSAHELSLSALSKRCCLSDDSSKRCKTTPTRMPSLTSSPLVRSYWASSLSNASTFAIMSPEKSKFSKPSKTPANRVRTFGSNRRHSDRHARSPSPDPALTTWSNAAPLHNITMMNASCSLDSRWPCVVITALPIGSSVSSAACISAARNSLHADVYERTTTFQSRHFAADPSNVSGLPSPRVSMDECLCPVAADPAVNPLTVACSVAFAPLCVTTSLSNSRILFRISTIMSSITWTLWSSPGPRHGWPWGNSADAGRAGPRSVAVCVGGEDDEAQPPTALPL